MNQQSCDISYSLQHPSSSSQCTRYVVSASNAPSGQWPLWTVQHMTAPFTSVLFKKIQTNTTHFILYKTIQHTSYYTKQYNTLHIIQNNTTHFILYKTIQHTSYYTKQYNTLHIIQNNTIHFILYKTIQYTSFYTIGFDSSLILIPQLKTVAKASFFHLCRIKQLKLFLDNPTLKLLVSLLILSRFDYCNSLYYRLPETTLHYLTKAFNSAASLVFGTPRFSRLTPTFIPSHWLFL